MPFSLKSIFVLIALAHFAQAENDLPTWENSQYQKMLKGDWPAGNILPDLSEKPATPVPSTTPPNSNEKTTVIPENRKEVPKLFQSEFLRLGTKGASLIDPQGLLHEQESEDVKFLLEQIRKDFNINIQISVFFPTQEVFIDLNAPALALQIFQKKERCVLIEYRLDRPDLSQIAFSKDLSDLISDSERSSLLTFCKSEAQKYSAEPDKIVKFLTTFTTICPSLKKKADMLASSHAVKPEINLPDVNYEINEKEEPKKEDGIFKKICLAIEPLIPAICFSGMGLALGAGLVWGFFFLRSRRKIQLPSQPPNTRLGAKNGALVSQTVHFNNTSYIISQDKNLITTFLSK